MLSTALFCALLGSGPFEVTAVERTEAHAARLGKRVEYTLTFERDGKSYTVRVGRVHTRVGGDPDYRTGDKVFVRGAEEGRVAFILPDAIRKA